MPSPRHQERQNNRDSISAAAAAVAVVRVSRSAPPRYHASRIPGRSGERKEGRKSLRTDGPTAEPPTSHYLLRARHYRIAFH